MNYNILNPFYDGPQTITIIRKFELIKITKKWFCTIDFMRYRRMWFTFSFSKTHLDYWPRYSNYLMHFGILGYCCVLQLCHDKESWQ